MEAEGRVVAEWCRQGETLLRPSLSLHNQQGIHNSKTPPPSPREGRTSDRKGGRAGTHRGGGTGETARVVPAVLASGPGSWAQRTWEPQEGRSTWLQPQAAAASAATGTRERRQWGLGPERRPLPARPTVAAPQTLAGVPPTIQALLHPHTPPAAAEPVNQGTSGKAKGARHADAPGQDTRDTGSLALKTTGAQATPLKKATDSGGRGFHLRQPGGETEELCFSATCWETKERPLHSNLQKRKRFFLFQKKRHVYTHSWFIFLYSRN